MAHLESTSAAPPADPRRWRALAVLALVQFIIFLDVTIVNVALPSIQADLGFTADGLTWVVNGYLLAAGGLLLLGGRLADIVGRRRMFCAGAALFAASSLLAATAQNQEMLIAGRFAQGIAEAIAAPAAMSLVALLFTDPGERGKAFAIWGGLAGLGSAAGVLLSGVLTEFASWRWVFYVNVPLAVIPLLIAPKLLSESRMAGARKPSWISAILATGGLVAIIQGVLSAATHPFGSGPVLWPLVGGVAALLLFLVIQAKSENPLVPLRFFANRTRVTGNVSVVFLAGSTAAMFFLVVLYMQEVLHYSPLQAGLAWLPFCVVFVPGLTMATKLLPRVGPRGTLAAGLLVAAAGVLTLTWAPVDGSYWLNLLPAFVLIGFGGGLANPAVQTAALADVSQEDAGLGSGVLTTIQQLGQALGLTAIVAVALTHTASLVAGGTAAAEATTGGYRLAFLVSGIVLVVGAALAVVLLPSAKRAGAAQPAASDEVAETAAA
ncbi:MFS transporter [Actinokineospora auranticolor]|uniref:EmrB/QacA subfamily drug resistance transporter n=1 Tax=Actinokineospora auranticolor TaxID=155976 RepID=A0A2S6GDI1_9PSEU|nr:MFS transporter [Actinokineospora auranticolor]PPK63146.1 EmrB/QacA subfamily drug resistance transporter [Actinokineospora auranticolor]